MKLSFDREADALLLELRPVMMGEVKESRSVASGISLLLDADGKPLAIEVRDLSKIAGRPVLEHLDLDLAPPFAREEHDFEVTPRLEAWLEANTEWSKVPRKAKAKA